MSEQSDAVVVVVSEETGGISVARKGELERDIQTGKLREILLSSLLKNERRSEPGNKDNNDLTKQKKSKRLNKKASVDNKEASEPKDNGGESNEEQQ